ncbi:MBL fold metallo-hydrolase [Halogeometricum sp. S1BR25-6]|uniref:MBL fold metallo-hydrolase n=1 Tax=Halogeometricum salsisoli TaxID=2950536 RepID=A0ABU2GFB4_9EURY|nr:MBL fold metallo-hydrolase [Halogeometricum sp. S1BR25-6]MDS0298808.1 MBL fold metallo-hydrolase [Halogeometricum sp. S1BR25-6]
MTPEGLHERLERGGSVSLLDVRNRDEHDAWHVDGEGVETTLVPYSKFMAAAARGDVAETAREAGLDPENPVVVVCGRGEASAFVADRLREAGFEAENLDDGMRGWARVYVSVVVPADVNAVIHQYRRPASGCLAYFVVSDSEAAVIDPLRQFTERYVTDAREYGADLVYALDTHVHADHVSGVRRLAAETDATAVYPEGARDRGLDVDAAAEFVADGDEIRVGDATLTAVHAPGHTSEMTAYRLGDMLFSGDSLFVESVARPDLEVGDEGATDAARQLYGTLRTVFDEFHDDVRVAPAHYGDAADRRTDGTYSAYLGDLRDGLPLLMLSEERFVEAVLSDMPPRPANYEDIIATNLGLSEVADAEAFELELGPNNCAVSQAD